MRGREGASDRGTRLAEPSGSEVAETTMAIGIAPIRWLARTGVAGILTVAAGALTAGADAPARWQPPETIAAAARAAATEAGAD